ncbi:MAG: hypothetical protein U0610_02685 [bacterium]
MNGSSLTQDEAFVALASVLARFAREPSVMRMKVRVREQGDNQRDEVRQLAELTRACRESPALAQALAEAGLGRLADLDLHAVAPGTGVLVQAFNRLVEQRWEEE